MRALLTLLAVGAPLAGQNLASVGTSHPAFAVADVRAADIDGDGKQELLVLGERGEIRLLTPDSGALRGSFQLPNPTRTLLSFARLGPGKALDLIVMDSKGLFAHRFDGDGFAAKGRRLLRRGKLALRVGTPRFADFVQDINQDGRPDLVVPTATDCALYLNRIDSSTKVAEFEFASRLGLRVTVESTTRATPLHRTLSHSVTIPNLRTKDVNGDGRGDLVAEVGTRRLFHMQRADGTFPAKPDVVLDLARFRDTTPKAEIELGRTLAQDDAILHSQDLDGDKIPDYVLAHRRKVWVYHGSKRGPQFDRPSKILILKEDVTFLLLMHLDDDAFPDLLVFKLQVPTLATLALGLFAEWDVTIRSIGYKNEGGKTFGRTPKWRRETVIRVPSIVGLINDPESIVTKFEGVGKSFRLARSADLDGDQDRDVLMQTEDGKRLEFWLLDTTPGEGDKAVDKEFRGVLFEAKNNVWDVDRILGLLRSIAEQRTTRLTRGKHATGAVALRDPKKWRLVSITPVDLDGDGRRELALHYASLGDDRASLLDILRLAK